MEDIIYINDYNGEARVVGADYPNSTAYIAKSEYERLQEENERNQNAASDYRYQCMVHEECRRDIEEKYAQALREKDKWEQVADKQDTAIAQLKARLGETEGK